MREIEKEISSLINTGLKVMIDGYQITKEIDMHREMLREESYYMKDFIWDEMGNCVQINFDSINIE